MLTIVMCQRIGAWYMISLADNRTMAKDGWRPMDSEIGCSDSFVRHAVALGTKMTADHASAESGKGDENVGNCMVELVICHIGYGDGG